MEDTHLRQKTPTNSRKIHEKRQTSNSNLNVEINFDDKELIRKQKNETWKLAENHPNIVIQGKLKHEKGFVYLTL